MQAKGRLDCYGGIVDVRVDEVVGGRVGGIVGGIAITHSGMQIIIGMPNPRRWSRVMEDTYGTTKHMCGRKANRCDACCMGGSSSSRPGSCCLNIKHPTSPHDRRQEPSSQSSPNKEDNGPDRSYCYFLRAGPASWIKYPHRPSDPTCPPQHLPACLNQSDGSLLDREAHRSK